MSALFLITAVAPISAQPIQSVPSGTANREEARAQTRLALELDRTGRYQEAVAAYKRALALAPHDAGLYNNLGNALANLGCFDEAIAAFQQAVEFSGPDFLPLVYVNLGLAYVQTDSVKANETLKHAISLNPKFAKARLGLCDLHLALRQNGEAVACYKAVLPNVPSAAKAHIHFGIALSRVGRHKEAIVALREAVRRFPSDAEAYNQLGSALIQAGRYKEAVRYLTRAIELDPNNQSVHFNLGVAELAGKNRVRALEHYVFLKHLNADLAQQLYEMIYGGRLLSAGRK